VSLAQCFVSLWKAREIPPVDPDVIIAICYGVLPNQLADGTLATLEKAIMLAGEFPRSVIAFGNAAICFPGSEHVEHREKIEILAQSGFPFQRVVEAFAIYNTVTEARAIKKELESAKVPTREITIIAGEAHSRSVMYIYRKVFPDTKLSLVHVPFKKEHQPNHTVTLQTGPWLWIAANIARQLALWVLGLERVGAITHHTKIRS